MKKKSYNPFKMWGSWIGALLISIVPLPFCISSIGGTGCGWTPYGVLYFVNLPMSLILGFIISGVGFLLGWGIHSLIRKFRRKRR